MNRWLWIISEYLQAARANLARNRLYLAIRVVALSGGLVVGSCVYMLRFALDYADWLPNKQGVLPALAMRSGDALFVAAVMLHVDVALWNCLRLFGTIFLLGSIALFGRAMFPPRYERPAIVHFL